MKGIIIWAAVLISLGILVSCGSKAECEKAGGKYLVFSGKCFPKK